MSFESNALKFRELSADKVTYYENTHTSVLPRIVTVTSVLPIPRKGNPGTNKTVINYHHNVVLDAGTDLERVVPIVQKFELSLPVGTDPLDLSAALVISRDLIKETYSQTSDLYTKGILPTGIVPVVV